MTTVIDHTQRGHSPLGASGAERWMNCPGSVSLIKRLRGDLDKMDMPPEDDPDYRREGTAMHEAAEHCLRQGLDTWEIVGQEFNRTVIDAPMADAIQVYVDICRVDMDRSTWHQIEFPVSSPVHPDFCGTADFTAFIVEGPALPRLMSEPQPDTSWLLVRDLKGGEGIVVEPEDNAQLKYYAFGVIDGWERQIGTILHPDIKVRLSIAQPRAFHESGESVREWDTTVGEIKAWVKAELLPAMANAEVDGTLDAGPWCRFCPAKLICPMLVGLARAAATANPGEVVSYSDENIGRSYQHVQAIKFYLKALEEEAFRRANHEQRPGFEGLIKLVPKKSNRVWSVGASAIKAKFGDDAMTKPEVKSPAELEKLSPEAKAFVKEHAYHPQTGYTIALWEDRRPAVIVRKTEEVFGEALSKLLDKGDATA